MRVAVGGIYHESNSFCSQLTTLDRFAEGQLHFGQDVVRMWQGTSSEMSGFLEGARLFKFEVVPTLMAWAVPSGIVTSETFETLVQGLVLGLRSAGRIDGVLLSLHGAMVSEIYPDADGEILRRVRTVIGSKVPLVVTLDFHANLTEEMVVSPDALLGYKTYPHIDQVDRGIEAATILQRIMCQGLRPKMALERRPLLPQILCQSTERPPMAEIMAAAQERERTQSVVNVTVAAGFAYTDVPQAGLSVLATAENSETARSVAREIADMVWLRRTEFTCEITQPAAAVAKAIAHREGLTVLVDVGDNVGAGTPGDGTVLLSELLNQGADGALVLLCDAEVVAACLAVGVRGALRVKVGGKCDRLHGEPVEVSATVKLLADGKYRNDGPMRDGVWEDQGRTAVLDTGKILIVITERRMPMWNLQQLRALGIEPTKLRIIVVKAAIAYRAAYAPIARQVIEADTPGLSTADVRRLQYTRLQRPIFPLDSL